MHLNKNVGKGGNAGDIFIAARKITSSPEAKIMASGGDGSTGGKGGKITIISEDNQFQGEVSAKGGTSFSSSPRWWERTWIQVLFLLSAIIGIITFVQSFTSSKKNGELPLNPPEIHSIAEYDARLSSACTAEQSNKQFFAICATH
jgi:hypothetical protein